MHKPSLLNRGFNGETSLIVACIFLDPTKTLCGLYQRCAAHTAYTTKYVQINARENICIRAYTHRLCIYRADMSIYIFFPNSAGTTSRSIDVPSNLQYK